MLMKPGGAIMPYIIRQCGGEAPSAVEKEKEPSGKQVGGSGKRLGGLFSGKGAGVTTTNNPAPLGNGGGSSGSFQGSTAFAAGRVSILLTLSHTPAAEVVPFVQQLWDIQVGCIDAASGRERSRLDALVASRREGPFNLSLLSDYRERPLTRTSPAPTAERVFPLVSCPGRIAVTPTALYFEPVAVNNLSGSDPVQKWALRDVAQVLRRPRLQRPVGLEVVLVEGTQGSGTLGGTDLLAAGLHGDHASTRNVYFAFDRPSERDEVYSHLLDALKAVKGIDVDGGVISSMAEVTGTIVDGGGVGGGCGGGGDRTTVVGLPRDLGDPPLTRIFEATRAWQARALSTYEYLMLLNSFSGRSRCDLTAYPVLPWVLSDYRSQTLDLTDPGVYRDLSKPVGALNPRRLASLKERFREMPRGGPEDDPPFLYGTHYSTPGYCLYFLARTMPEHILRLQSGRFDAPDRMFHDIATTWAGVTGTNSDFKELIPEFYDSDGGFTLMPEGLNLGVRQNGKRLGDVELPPWAYDASDFVSQMREALEGDHVSAHIASWIDLIFGVKSRGPAAETADNLFYYLTYEGALELEGITDPDLLASKQNQIAEFGQTPRQLFHSTHPARGDPLAPSSSLHPLPPHDESRGFSCSSAAVPPTTTDNDDDHGGDEKKTVEEGTEPPRIPLTQDQPKVSLTASTATTTNSTISWGGSLITGETNGLPIPGSESDGGGGTIKMVPRADIEMISSESMPKGSTEEGSKASSSSFSSSSNTAGFSTQQLQQPTSFTLSSLKWSPHCLQGSAAGGEKASSGVGGHAEHVHCCFAALRGAGDSAMEIFTGGQGGSAGQTYIPLPLKSQTVVATSFTRQRFLPPPSSLPLTPTSILFAALHGDEAGSPIRACTSVGVAATSRNSRNNSGSSSNNNNSGGGGGALIFATLGGSLYSLPLGNDREGSIGTGQEVSSALINPIFPAASASAILSLDTSTVEFRGLGSCTLVFAGCSDGSIVVWGWSSSTGSFSPKPLLAGHPHTPQQLVKRDRSGSTASTSLVTATEEGPSSSSSTVIKNNASLAGITALAVGAGAAAAAPVTHGSKEAPPLLSIMLALGDANGGLSLAFLRIQAQASPPPPLEHERKPYFPLDAHHHHHHHHTGNAESTTDVWGGCCSAEWENGGARLPGMCEGGVPFSSSSAARGEILLGGVSGITGLVWAGGLQKDTRKLVSSGSDGRLVVWCTPVVDHFASAVSSLPPPTPLVIVATGFVIRALRAFENEVVTAGAGGKCLVWSLDTILDVVGGGGGVGCKRLTGSEACPLELSPVVGDTTTQQHITSLFLLPTSSSSAIILAGTKEGGLSMWQGVQ